MPESDYYATGHRRDAVYSSDEDDERYKRTTVRRYKVGHGQVERVEQVERERIEDDGLGPWDQRGGRHSSNNIEVDRRIYAPERPRSAVEITEHTRRYYGDDGHRAVYETTKDVDRDTGRHSRNREGLSQIQSRDERDDQIIVESYSKDRHGDGHGGEVERWHKETEYYEPSIPPPAPIVIRPRPVEQKIILQDSLAPAPVIIPHQGQVALVARDRERLRQKDSREEEDYYYERQERREVVPYRDEREGLVVGKLGHRSHNPSHHHRHHTHHRDYASDGELTSEDDYYVTKKTVIRREISPPASERRRHLAGGALAGAGIGALLGSRRNQDGELPEHRGRKVLAGAALGALGTEVLKRAHSTYNDRFGDDHSRPASRERSRSPSHHSTLKTGLGIAAAALAVAGAAKYLQSSRIDREERNRGRSLRRYSDDERYDSRSPSRTSRKARSRASSVAKVAAGTAAVAGIVHHFRSKSRGQSGKSRSRSRLRTGAEIVAAGLAGAAAKKLYDKHKDKKEGERDRSLAEEEYEEEHRNRQLESRPHSRSRSQSRSQSRSHSRSRPQSRSGTRAGATRSPHHPDVGYSPPPGADPELGLVEYGARPLYSDPPYPESRTHDTGGYHSGYCSAAENSEYDGRHRRSHTRDQGSRGASDIYDDADNTSYDNGDASEYGHAKKGKDNRSRSRSRLRNFAAAGAGAAAAAAAAAIGIKKYDRKKVDKRDISSSERRIAHQENYGSSGQDKVRGSLERSHEFHKDRDDSRKGYSSDDRPPSPTHASGGAFYPPRRQSASTSMPNGMMQHSNAASTALNSASGHTHNYASPPPAPSDQTAPTASSSGITASREQVPIPNSTRETAVNPRVNTTLDNFPPRDADNAIDLEGWSVPDDVSGADDQEKSVAFIPLSPQSSRTLIRHHAEVQNHSHTRKREGNLCEDKEQGGPLVPYHRRLRSHASERSSQDESQSRRRKMSDDADGDAVEVLPDRFDSHGHLLSGKGWNMIGGWGVSGNDTNIVNPTAQNISEIIDSFAGRQLGFRDTVSEVLHGLGNVKTVLNDTPDINHDINGRPSGDGDDKKRKRPCHDHGDRLDRDSNPRDGLHLRERRAASTDNCGNYYEHDTDRDSRKRRRSWCG